MTEAETLRLLLQNKFDRIENLVQMNHAATLAVPSVLATIWGIEGGLNNFRNAWILSIISIGLLIIWRYFAHYLDSDIVEKYLEIVKIENQLHVSITFALFNNLIDTFQKNWICIPKDSDEKILRFIKSIPSEKRLALLKLLSNDKKMGSRGHDFLDAIAIMLAGFFFLIVFLQIGFFSIFIGVVIILSYLYVVNRVAVQSNPSILDIKEALEKIKCPFNEI